MKDFYFVKYSSMHPDQPCRIHQNCNLEVEKGTINYWDFLNSLIRDEHLHSNKDVVIDFMIKVGEIE